MKDIDNVGRIVIPKDSRRKYGLVDGTKIEFFEADDGITIKVCQPLCKICHAKISHSKSVPLCDKCTFEVVNRYYEQK